MSNDRAIAEVTTALQHLLQAAIAIDPDVGDGKVTSRPPDSARKNEAGNQLNLFLYRTAIDAAWRNADPPSARPGEPGISPLALVLSYVVTAYGAADDDLLAHRLLGIAMRTLHDNPVLPRESLADLALVSGVDVQPERVRITPGPIPQDELSRMWSTFGTGYRISVTYDVSTVLIDSTRVMPTPLPVLTRGQDDQGPLVAGGVTSAHLTGMAPLVSGLTKSPLRPDPNKAFAVDLVLTGQFLGEVESLTVTGRQLAQPVEVVPQSVSDQEIQASLPAGTLPAGSFSLVANLPGRPAASVEVPFAVAPAISQASPLVARLAAGSGTVKLTCSPDAVQGQPVELVIRDRTFAGTVSKRDGSKLSFDVTGMETGTYPIRLRVDRQDSLLNAGGSPAFHELELR